MKFYSEFNLNSLLNCYRYSSEFNKNNHRYKIHHFYFYLCLLPEKIKLEIINNFRKEYPESYLIFNRILNVKDSFCFNIEESDYVVIPCNFTTLIGASQNLLEHSELIKKAFHYNKKILFFHGSDNDLPSKIDKKHGVIFRNSGFLSQHNSNIFGCPTFNKFYRTEILKEKNISVSFCGSVKNEERKKVFSQIKKYSYFNYIEQQTWGGGLGEENVKIFYENLKENLYSLCIRGGGNFSFRLAETFMMGRIPILIDTDCILPFRGFIPYEKNTVYVTKENSKNFTDIDSVIQEYHNFHTMEELIEIQKENVKIWYNYFTVDNAFYNTCKILENIK